MEGIIAHWYFWQLEKMQHMETHPHHLQASLLWLSVFTHWDSEIVPPT